ncbi:hypothetical protein GCM10011396_40240 [Undibacterium terreum]|uniref:Uncharacterized protein n=1 Tax=Undibacterium terreum TaxID=1224302 RepID=A0A916UVF9_9BURK|nr:hypothetical protein GCM10011396_40240 [Undibacterium terreum]
MDASDVLARISLRLIPAPCSGVICADADDSASVSPADAVEELDCVAIDIILAKDRSKAGMRPASSFKNPL